MTNQLVLKVTLNTIRGNNSNYGKTILEVFLPGPGYSRWLFLNGSGNGFIGVGTGNIYYGQVGYLFVKPTNPATKGDCKLCSGTNCRLRCIK
jgi:hypothetical protein